MLRFKTTRTLEGNVKYFSLHLNLNNTYMYKWEDYDRRVVLNAAQVLDFAEFSLTMTCRLFHSCKTWTFLQCVLLKLKEYIKEWTVPVQIILNMMQRPFLKMFYRFLVAVHVSDISWQEVNMYPSCCRAMQLYLNGIHTYITLIQMPSITSVFPAWYVYWRCSCSLMGKAWQVLPGC